MSKRRLTPAAYAILNDYFTNVSDWPDPDAQEELAERVRRVPGCDFYTARQVYQYFANCRLKVRGSGKAAVLATGEHGRRRGRPSKASADKRGPGPSRASLDSDSLINKLNVLLDDEPDPSPELVDVWAERLGNGVVPEHILTYAFLRRAQSGQQPKPQLSATAQSPELRPERQRPIVAPQLRQFVESRAALDAPAGPSFSPQSSPHGEPTACPQPPSAAITPFPPSTHDERAQAAEPTPRSAPGLVLKRDDNAAAGAPAPLLANLPARPDELVERVRTALVEADTQGARECPKTFADFARWLKMHNEDRAADPVLYTTKAARRA